MRTMAEEPLLPALAVPVTTRRWAVLRFGTTLDGVRVICILGENERHFFYAVQGSKGAEVRGARKSEIEGRFNSEDDARAAILRAKIAWDEDATLVKAARDHLRETQAQRDAKWRAALTGKRNG